MEESTSRCDSRKCPSEARPANLCAYRVVPSLVADFVMTLLRGLLSVPAFRALPLRWPSEPGVESRPEESYDRASPFRGRKSHLRADCCSTSAPPSTSVPRYRLKRKLIRSLGNRERVVRRTAAGWRFPQSARKTARPGGRRGLRIPRSFAPRRHAAKLRHRDLVCAASVPDGRAGLRRASRLFCGAPRRARSPAARWLFRALPQWKRASNRRSFPGNARAAEPRRRTPLCCTPRSRSRGKWAVVGSARRYSRFVYRNPAGDVAARVSIAQIEFEDGGRPQAHQVAIALGKEMFCVLVVSERLFERGTCQAIADASREVAQVQTFACRINGTEKPLQAPLQILRSNQKRLGFSFA